jgi:lysozyme family protein
MTDLVALKAANGKRWANARLKRDFSTVAKHLAAAKSRYQAVSARSGVPWPFSAVVHEREAAQNWATQLGQGDPLDRVSTHIPRGRGPFKTWEDGAYDALVNCAPFAACNKDWSIGGTLTKLEEYNGLGYAARNQPSPYLWSGTDQYKCGKYVRDGVFDPDVVDSQLGCVGLLMAMMALDPSITFDEAGPSVGPRRPVPIPACTQKSSQPSITKPSKGSIGAFVASLIAAIFKRK